MVVSITVLALLTCLCRQDGAAAHDPVEIQVDEVLDGELTPQDSTFSSPTLSQYPWHGEQVPCDRYWLVLDEAGPCTVSVESLDVGPFLALEDKEAHTTRE